MNLYFKSCLLLLVMGSFSVFGGSFGSSCPSQSASKYNVSLSTASFSGVPESSHAYELSITNNVSNWRCGSADFVIESISSSSSLSSSIMNTVSISRGETKVLSGVVNILASASPSQKEILIKVRNTNDGHIYEKVININILPVVEPTPICNRSNPSLLISPNNFTGVEGDNYNFNLSLTNNNQNCEPTNYQLSYESLPVGFNSNIPTLIQLENDQTVSIAVTMTAGAAGSHSFYLKAIDESSSVYSVSSALNFVLSEAVTPSGLALISVGSENITLNSADIRWKLNASSTGQIEYGTTVNLGSFSALESSFNYSEHVQTIAGLSPDTLYYYKVKSTDISGSSVESDLQTFTTIEAPNECIKAAPSLNLNLSSVNLDAGSTGLVNLTILNNNLNCPPQSFSFDLLNAPSGISASFGNSQAVVSGEQQIVSMNLSSLATLSSSSSLVVVRLIATDDITYSAQAELTLNIAALEVPPTTSELIYPPQVLLSELSYASYVAPSGSVPGYLQRFTDSITGNYVTRVSDHAAFGVSPSSGYQVRHRYAKNQVWNADGSLIKMAGATTRLIDGSTFELISTVSNFPSKGSWSNIDSKLLYSVNNGEFSSYRLNASNTSITKTVLFAPSNISSLSFGEGEGNLSNDDRFVGLVGYENGNRKFIVYDIQNNTSTSITDVDTNIELDWFSVSQLGNYAVAQYARSHIVVYDINLNNRRVIPNVLPAHGDIGIDTQGNEVLVEYGQSREWNTKHSLYMVRLDGQGGADGNGYTPLMPYTLNQNGNRQGIWGGHISTRNTKRPGWAYVSEQCCSVGSDTAASEVFALKLDASGTIERYGKHHNDQIGGDFHSAQAVPNQDGTKVFFASNWRDNYLKSLLSPPSFVIEVPQ